MSNTAIYFVKFYENNELFFNKLQTGRLGINFYDTKGLICDLFNHANKNGISNHSFHIMRGEIRIATVLMYSRNGKLFDHTGSETPIKVIITDTNIVDIEKLYKIAYDEILSFAFSNNIDIVTIFEDELDLLYSRVFSKSHCIYETYRASLVDLKKEVPIKKIRSSFLSNINWARKNLKISYFGSNELNEEFTNTVQAILLNLLSETIAKHGDLFYRDGFQTQMQTIRENGGEISIATYKNSIVGIIVILDYDDYSYYALGGSKKEIGEFNNKNIHPYLLLDATERCKIRGSSVLVYDRLYNASRVQLNDLNLVTLGNHQVNLHFFKSGMANDGFKKNALKIFLKL